MKNNSLKQNAPETNEATESPSVRIIREKFTNIPKYPRSTSNSAKLFTNVNVRNMKNSFEKRISESSNSPSNFASKSASRRESFNRDCETENHLGLDENSLMKINSELSLLSPRPKLPSPERDTSRVGSPTKTVVNVELLPGSVRKIKKSFEALNLSPEQRSSITRSRPTVKKQREPSYDKARAIFERDPVRRSELERSISRQRDDDPCESSIYSCNDTSVCSNISVPTNTTASTSSSSVPRWIPKNEKEHQYQQYHGQVYKTSDIVTDNGGKRNAIISTSPNVAAARRFSDEDQRTPRSSLTKLNDSGFNSQSLHKKTPETPSPNKQVYGQHVKQLAKHFDNDESTFSKTASPKSPSVYRRITDQANQTKESLNKDFHFTVNEIERITQLLRDEEIFDSREEKRSAKNDSDDENYFYKH